ncbi:hypothetical protein NYR75_02815 [Actinobacillus equuli subsp. haemolyticus]|uniref:ATP-binding protein n=1 Tax=Actinobacillus equuli subsp. equuli TaxID=202947 RepID=A0A9X4G3I2_ACTEU|nr:hypothetical protein [Actinobacillus equuli]MDE8034628.1 hypothetical protein [Actinobacillus equuli subsp. equuli]MDG4948736.1 hypothetical protein [Actinobacillus equuli subsp. haemolyticus]WGE63773.1 hypothetical protein NYR75_02815 [Actinobacillus equuli subsp. haemolyticus]
MRKHNSTIFYKQGDAYVFRCPSILDIYSSQHYEQTVRFIQSLEQVSRLNMKKVIISFFHCTSIKAAAAVLLYAQLETLLKSSDVSIQLKTGVNFSVNRVLKTSGFDYLCKHRMSANVFDHQQDFLPIISGRGGLYRDEIVDYIKQVIYNNQLSDTEEYIFSDAIYEAIDNIGLHAYDFSDPEKLWWLKCSVFNDELYLVLYDKGKSIPATFTRGNQFFDEIDWQSPEMIEQLVQHHKAWGLQKPLDIDTIAQTSMGDEIAISFAMSDEITRIDNEDEDKHGQGSKSIKKLVSDHPNGLLWVFSRGGLLYFENEHKMPQLRRNITPIQGTIIQWNIGVKKCQI